MNWDLSKFNVCEIHGHHAGKECPLCAAMPPLSPCDAATSTVPCRHFDHAIPPTEEYDRTTWHKGPEKELHEWLEAELIRLGISYIHSRTDVKSTCANGTPDFACFFTAGDGVCRFCFIELKNKTGRLSQIQIEVIRDLESKKVPVLVTGSFTEAKMFLIEKLDLGKLTP